MHRCCEEKKVVTSVKHLNTVLVRISCGLVFFYTPFSTAICEADFQIIGWKSYIATQMHPSGGWCGKKPIILQSVAILTDQMASQLGTIYYVTQYEPTISHNEGFQTLWPFSCETGERLMKLSLWACEKLGPNTWP